MPRFFLVDKSLSATIAYFPAPAKKNAKFQKRIRMFCIPKPFSGSGWADRVGGRGRAVRVWARVYSAERLGRAGARHPAAWVDYA
jgi:hypothetical protein